MRKSISFRDFSYCMHLIWSKDSCKSCDGANVFSRLSFLPGMLAYASLLMRKKASRIDTCLLVRLSYNTLSPFPAKRSSLPSNYLTNSRPHLLNSGVYLIVCHDGALPDRSNDPENNNSSNWIDYDLSFDEEPLQWIILKILVLEFMNWSLILSFKQSTTIACE